MSRLNKKYFIVSLLIHIFLIIYILFSTKNHNIKKHFIVYGAHSKKTTQAYFNPVENVNKTDWLKKRLDQEKSKQKTIKKIAKKKKPKVTKKPKPKSKQKTKPKIKPRPKTKKQSKSKRQQKKPVKKTAKKAIKTKQTHKKKEPIQEFIPKENLQDLRFNLLETTDPKLAMYQKNIQQEVERLWRPPVGVPKTTECSLYFTVSSKGKIEQFEITKKSNVLIFDLSIIKIARNFSFDTCLWGKKFTIDFRQ